MTIFRFNKTVVTIAVLSLATLLFFTFVNLTQRQAVGAMFLCIFAGLGYWFSKKPWR